MLGLCVCSERPRALKTLRWRCGSLRGRNTFGVERAPAHCEVSYRMRPHQGGRLAQPRGSHRLTKSCKRSILMKNFQMMFESVDRRCRHCRIIKLIPYINDPFTEEVLPQIQSCTFLSQLQGMTPGTTVCRKFEEGTKFYR